MGRMDCKKNLALRHTIGDDHRFGVVYFPGDVSLDFSMLIRSGWGFDDLGVLLTPWTVFSLPDVGLSVLDSLGPNRTVLDEFSMEQIGGRRSGPGRRLTVMANPGTLLAGITIHRRSLPIIADH